MKRSSKARLYNRTGIWKLVALVLLAALSIPAYGDDSGANKSIEAQPPPSSELKPEITATPGDSVGATAATAPARPASAPSLEQVMDLLQAQGQELEAVKKELRDQKELT